MNEPDELTRLIRERTERLPIEIPSPASTMARGRRRRRVSVAVTTLAVLVIAVGVVLPLRALTHLGQDAPPMPVGPPSSIPVPEPTGTIAFIGGGQGFGPIKLLDLASGTTEPLTQQTFDSVGLAWSPDGSTIAATRGGGEGTPGEIVLVSTKTGEPIRTMPIDAQDVDWSPDGTFLAFTDSLGRLHTVGLDGSNVQDVPTDSRALDIAFSPKEDRIAYVGDKDDLKVMDLATGSTTVVFEEQPGQRVWFGPTWSPDGSQLAFSMFEDGGSSINVINADGTGFRTLIDASTGGTHPSWSPDGNWISFEGMGDQRDIYAVSTEGSTFRELTDSSLGEFGSDWGAASTIVEPPEAPQQFPPPVDGVSALPLSISPGRGGSSVVPVLYPDGTELEFVFGPESDLRGLGMRGTTLGDLGEDVGNGCCARSIEYYYGSPESTGFLGSRMVGSYPAADGGEVLLQEGDPEDGAELYLVYRFGPWTALVYDTVDHGMSEEERRSWAANLIGIVRPSGSLELRGQGPLSLEDPGYPTGPAMLIVGPSHDPEIFSYPQECEPSQDVTFHPYGEDGIFAEWCPRGGLAKVRASGDQSFVKAVVDTLEVRNPG